MAEFTETIRINAPQARVWSILADIGSIADWNPGLKASHATSPTEGLGATRHCNIDGKQSLDEEVVRFEPMRAITFRITRTTLPFQRADIRFSLADDAGQTAVQVSPSYRLKYGALGQALDRLFVARAYRKGMRGLLEGLKSKAEQQS